MKKIILIIGITVSLMLNMVGAVYADQKDVVTETVDNKVLYIENMIQDYENIDSDISIKDIVDEIFEIEDSVVRQDLLNKLNNVDEQRDEELSNKFLEESKEELEVIKRNKITDFWIGMFTIIMTFVFLIVAEITLI